MATKDKECCANAPKKDEPCCVGGESPAGGASQLRRQFGELMRAANAAGAIDAPTKQLIAVALSLALRCEPCAKHHLQQARRLGCTPEQIDEAVSLAIVFGGSPVMMFYKSVAATDN